MTNIDNTFRESVEILVTKLRLACLGENTNRTAGRTNLPAAPAACPTGQNGFRPPERSAAVRCSDDARHARDLGNGTNLLLEPLHDGGLGCRMPAVQRLQDRGPGVKKLPLRICFGPTWLMVAELGVSPLGALDEVWAEDAL